MVTSSLSHSGEHQEEAARPETRQGQDGCGVDDPGLGVWQSWALITGLSFLMCKMRVIMVIFQVVVMSDVKNTPKGVDTLIETLSAQ